MNGKNHTERIICGLKHFTGCNVSVAFDGNISLSPDTNTP